jgi:hypothetical protein
MRRKQKPEAMKRALRRAAEGRRPELRGYGMTGQPLAWSHPLRQYAVGEYGELHCRDEYPVAAPPLSKLMQLRAAPMWLLGSSP